MSTHPVLLGRVTRLNVGDAPKREDQTGPPGHGDIQASPSPPVTRVRHGDSEDRPSWTWRCVQMFIALLIVIFTTWLAIAPVSEGSWETPHTTWLSRYENEEVAALKDDPSFISLMVSTGLAGLAAMWLYLIAPTAHTLLAASFLCLNWVEGLVTLSSITAMRRTFIMQDGASKRSLVDILATLRVFLLLCEFLGMQFIIQNRLQSLWPALNRPRMQSVVGSVPADGSCHFFPLLLEQLPGTNVGRDFCVQDQGCEFCCVCDRIIGRSLHTNFRYLLLNLECADNR